MLATNLATFSGCRQQNTRFSRPLPKLCQGKMMRYPQARLLFWICIRMMRPLGGWTHEPSIIRAGGKIGHFTSLIRVMRAHSVWPELSHHIAPWGHQTFVECGLQRGFGELGSTEMQDQFDGTESALVFYSFSGKRFQKTHKNWCFSIVMLVYQRVL